MTFGIIDRPFAKTMLLCLSSVDLGVLEEAVDLAGDVAFEAALGFSGGSAFGGSFGDVGLGVGAVAAAGDGDGVQRAVELAVAAAVEAVAVSCPEDASSGATPARRAKAASLRQRPGCDQAM